MNNNLKFWRVEALMEATRSSWTHIVCSIFAFAGYHSWSPRATSMATVSVLIGFFRYLDTNPPLPRFAWWRKLSSKRPMSLLPTATWRCTAWRAQVVIGHDVVPTYMVLIYRITVVSLVSAIWLGWSDRPSAWRPCLCKYMCDGDVRCIAKVESHVKYVLSCCTEGGMGSSQVWYTVARKSVCRKWDRHTSTNDIKEIGALLTLDNSLMLNPYVPLVLLWSFLFIPQKGYTFAHTYCGEV